MSNEKSTREDSAPLAPTKSKCVPTKFQVRDNRVQTEVWNSVMLPCSRWSRGYLVVAHCIFRNVTMFLFIHMVSYRVLC